MDHWRAHPQYENIKERLDVYPYHITRGEKYCSELVWKDGQARCNIYDTRPELCQSFPSIPYAIETIPSCTYTFKQVE